MNDSLTLQQCSNIASLDEELKPEELAEKETDRRRLLDSVEGFYRGPAPNIFILFPFYRHLAKLGPKTDAERRVVARGREIRFIAEWLLDDCFSRLMIKEVPRIVSRAMQLDPGLTERSSPADDDYYLREATRCYLFGLPSAAMALCRSALEQAFSKKVPGLLQVTARADRLMLLISTARKSILRRAPEVCNLADTIRKNANAAVHGKRAGEKQAFEMLRGTTIVIDFLHRCDR
jgi:hypothetical protein